MGKVQDTGWAALGMLIMVSMWALSILQCAATISGLEYWLEWNGIVCTVIAVIIVFVMRLTLISLVLGIAGAHYGWDWTWASSALIFVGPLLVLMGISALIGAGSKLLRW